MQPGRVVLLDDETPLLRGRHCGLAGGFRRLFEVTLPAIGGEVSQHDRSRIFASASEPIMATILLGTKTPSMGWSSENTLKTLENGMAPRAYWKGTLKLSLVSCPVVLYPAATAAEKTRFHLINRETGNRLKQQMVDSETGDIVESEQKGRGYELRKGKYVEIEPEELEAVQIESNHTIDIESFVPSEEIDQRYLNHPYYIAPDGKAAVDAFAVIRDAMKDQDRVALAKIVLTNREHVMAIEPLGKGLLGTTLRYPYELRDEDQFFDDIKSPKISRDMVDLAGHNLHTKAAHFDPGKFKDEYEDALKALVKRKASGKKIELPEPEERPSNVVSLMDALKQSLKGRGGGKTAKSHARRTTERQRTAKKTHRSTARHRKAG